MADKKPHTPTSPNVPEARALTLDTWKAEVGEPHTALHQAVYRGTTDARMVERGREVDTAIILTAAPNFLASTRSIWSGLSPKQRALCKGYSPHLDPMLIAELLALREANVRYDALAQAGSVSITTRRAAAKAAFADGVIVRRTVYATLMDYFGADHPVMVALAVAVKSADTPELLASGMDAVARALRSLRHGDGTTKPSHDDVAVLDLAQLDDDTLHALEQGAERVRFTADQAAARPNDIAAAQRALDLQDGRVLHLIGLIVRAFRRGHRSDETVLVPTLGALGGLFETTRAKADDPEEDPAPAPPTPPAPPAPPVA